MKIFRVPPKMSRVPLICHPRPNPYDNGDRPPARLLRSARGGGGSARQTRFFRPRRFFKGSPSESSPDTPGRRTGGKQCAMGSSRGGVVSRSPTEGGRQSAGVRNQRLSCTRNARFQRTPRQRSGNATW